MRRLLAGLFALWRATLGAALPDTCRFTPTCSRYAAEAVLRHGVVVGSLRAAWRILRCNPLGRGGYDPVVRSRPPCRPASGRAPRLALRRR